MGCHHAHPARELFLPWQTSAPGTLSTCFAPVPSENDRAHRAYTEGSSTQDHFQYRRQERDCIEKTGELQELQEFSGVGEVGECYCHVPSPSTGWVEALSRCSDLLARFLQHVPGHIA